VNYSTYGDIRQQFPGNFTYLVKVTGDQFVSVTGTQPIKIVAIPGTKNS
jgi:hypothetical protein